MPPSLKRARRSHLLMFLNLFGLVLCAVGLAALWRQSGAATRLGQAGQEPAALAVSTTSQGQANQALIDEGRLLFLMERFDGNGRTCATCHRPERNFSLDPAFIATLAPNDPLFVAEFTPTLHGLEDAALLRQRGLVMVHVDGFTQPPVFRAPPPLWNLAFTAPYGHDGRIAALPEFIIDSVIQHFPKTLARVPVVDFRSPTPDELDALVAFLQSLTLPPEGSFSAEQQAHSAAQQRGQALTLSEGAFSVEQQAHSAAQQRGRNLFFEAARCGQCHGGPVFSDAHASPSRGSGNRAFDTGVNAQEPDANVQIVEAGRAFSTPSLWGVRHTAPYFHNNAAATLREAVGFYTSEAYNASPAAQEVGTIHLTASETDDVVAFLQELTCRRDGDVNSDHQVTPGDALLAFQYFLGLVSLDTCAQVRANVADAMHSGITPADALCIFRHFLGLPSCLDNTPPEAHAGPAQFVSPNPMTGAFSIVTLAGSGTDADDDAVTFLWNFDEVPSGSKLTAAALSAPTLATTTFKPDVLGMYKLSLTVIDTRGIASRDTVLVNVQAPTRQLPEFCSCTGKPGDLVALQTRVIDDKGKPVPNWPVTFNVESGDGTFQPAPQSLRLVAVSTNRLVQAGPTQTQQNAVTPLTDANGVASASLVLGQTSVQVVNTLARAQDVPNLVIYDVGQFFVAQPPVVVLFPSTEPAQNGPANVLVAQPPVAVLFPSVRSVQDEPTNVLVAQPPVTVQIMP